MIAFKRFFDEMIYLALVIKVLLRYVRRENIVEIEVFSSVAIIYFDFLPFRMLANARVGVAVFYLMLQERTDTNCSFDLTTH